ncbi:MAG: replication-associated recombination protein A [Ilumatobacteraceae bacterium]|jgi:putative ATPase
MGDDTLFSAAARERLAARSPLAARLRPRTLDEVAGQEHLTAPGRPLRRLVEADALSSTILWGPPGTGKTTLAEIIAATTNREFERLSAVTSGVKDIREVIERANDRIGQYARSTLVFIDEIHRFSTTQQDALLHAVESGLLTIIGATTENPSFSVNPALRSRSTVFRLQPLGEEALVAVLRRGLEAEGRSAAPGVLERLAARCAGDARQALTALEVACAISGTGDVGMDHAAAALDTSVQRFDRDAHYDIASPFIKSMRSGDVDSALHWLARMVEGGEDPRFIARRLVIFASEDVGTADPLALPVASAAASAVESVGMPEALHNLAHAVVHLARAPKSRAVTAAVWAAVGDVREGRTGEVPPIGPGTESFRPVGYRDFTYYREDDV